MIKHEVTLATMHSRCYFSIAIYGNDAVKCYVSVAGFLWWSCIVVYWCNIHTHECLFQ